MSRRKEHHQTWLRRMYPDGRPARPDLSGERKLILWFAVIAIGLVGLATGVGVYYSKAPVEETPAAAECPPTVTKAGIVAFVNPHQPESEAILTAVDTTDGSRVILTDEGYLVKTNPDGQTSLLGQVDLLTGLVVTIPQRLNNFPDCDWELTLSVTSAPQQPAGAGTFSYSLVAAPAGN